MAKRKARRAKPPKKFFSMRTVRLTGTSGHTAIVKATKPTLLPEVLWMEAIRRGCIEFDPEMITAAAEAAKAAAQEEVEAEATVEPKVIVRRAVQQVLMLDDPSALTNEGVPKVAVVKRLVGDPSIQIRSEMVYDLFLELTDGEGTLDPDDEDEDTLEDLEQRVDKAGLEDADGIDEPVGGGLAAVLAEANSGGGLEDDD